MDYVNLPPADEHVKKKSLFLLQANSSPMGGALWGGNGWKGEVGTTFAFSPSFFSHIETMNDPRSHAVREGKKVFLPSSLVESR